ncbi:MAG: GtrA family protein [Pseudomonadota bacterium]
MHRPARFACVGGLGFLVDAGLTTALIGQGLDPFSARLIAIGLAMLTTWRLNRALTFGASSDSQTREGARYAAVAIATATLNYGVYSALVFGLPWMHPAIAVAFATGVSMVSSYLGYSRFAFTQRI